MGITHEIKWPRLVLALLVTVVIADTMPHPNLSPGLLHNLADHLADRPQPGGADYFSTR